MSRRGAGGQRGWSLVELAVGLAITALVTGLLFALLPIGNRIVDGDRQYDELARAEQALLGHARAHARLPDADSDGDGRANAGSHEGWLPVGDLGLPPRMRIRYQVQPGLAQMPANLFEPLLPPDYQAQLDDVGNALDFCMQLLLDQRDGAALGGLDMPVAFYMAHSGQAGHALADASDAWRPAAQRLPGDAPTDGQDNAVAAVGPGEFATRLSCPDRLARAQGSAQGALAAWSAKRMTDFNLEFRKFHLEVADLVKQQSDTGLAFAALGLAMAIADEAIAITLTAAGWPPDGIAIGVGIGEHVVALASIGFAIYQVVMAEQDKQAADEEYDDAVEHLRLVTDYQAKVEALYRNAAANAIRLDKAGLEQ